MDFTSNIAIIVMAVFFGVYFLLVRLDVKSSVLTGYIAVASLAVYALWYPPAALIPAAYALLVRFGGRAVHRTRSKAVVAVMILIPLLVLACFKYWFIFVLVRTRGAGDMSNIFVPLGISFYTLTVIGHFIDLYRDREKPLEGIVDSLLLVCFWPTVGSGPILRTSQLFPASKRTLHIDRDTVALSMVLIATGIVKKLLIADNLGSYVNWNIGFGVDRMDMHEAWITIFAYAGQLYGDFSGYSDMAIGLALLLGVKLPANFNYPYVSGSMSELWRRWHISLSNWLRDYVYIPLGGSRKGKFRHYFNIVATFVVSGLWHGTGTNFLVWGLFHGSVLAAERAWYTAYLRVDHRVRKALTFVLFNIALVFFRLDMRNAVNMLKKMFGVGSLNFRITTAQYVLPPLVLLGFLVLEHAVRYYRVDDAGYPRIVESRAVAAVLCVMLVLALLFSGNEQPFIYFQF